MAPSKFPQPAVWWLSQSACESITEKEIEALPKYIQTEFSSRCGRAGGGRLWAAKQFDGFEIQEHLFGRTSLGRYITKDGMGGIVVSRQAIKALRALPGIITDHELRGIAE